MGASAGTVCRHRDPELGQEDFSRRVAPILGHKGDDAGNLGALNSFLVYSRRRLGLRV